MTVKITTDHLELLAPAFKGHSAIGSALRPRFQSLDELFNNHFSSIGDPNHPCRPTLYRALSELESKSARIVETGSAAWGTKSTLLLDSYVDSFGGSLVSTDIRFEPMFSLSQACTNNTTVYCDDSLNTLKALAREDKKIDLVYLDSWDVNISDPLPSAIHGFNEFLTLLPLLRKYGGLLLIDDTPLDFKVWHNVQNSSSEEFFLSFFSLYGFVPGKGGLVKSYLNNLGVGKMLAHEYQLLWKF